MLAGVKVGELWEKVTSVNIIILHTFIYASQGLTGIICKELVETLTIPWHGGVSMSDIKAIVQLYCNCIDPFIRISKLRSLPLMGSSETTTKLPELCTDLRT